MLEIYTTGTETIALESPISLIGHFYMKNPSAELACHIFDDGPTIDARNQRITELAPIPMTSAEVARSGRLIKSPAKPTQHKFSPINMSPLKPPKVTINLKPLTQTTKFQTNAKKTLPKTSGAYGDPKFFVQTLKKKENSESEELEYTDVPRHDPKFLLKNLLPPEFFKPKPPAQLMQESRKLTQLM